MTTTRDSSGSGAAQTTATGAGNDDGASAADRSRLAAVGDGAAEAYRKARERTTSAYEAARERAGDAYDSARRTAASAGRRTADGIDANPVAAVVGGLALGAVAAALLPRTRREEELFGTVGRRINDSAREAARAARDSAREQIGDLGLSGEGVRRKLDEFTDRAVGAARSSARGAKSSAVADGE